MLFDSFFSALTSPALKAIAAHWHEARGDDPMPRWERLRPARIAPHLTLVWAYRFDRASGDFFGRLAGERVMRAFEKNFRGLPLDEVLPAKIAARSRQMMRRVVTEPALHYVRGDLFRQGLRTVEGERIALPLAGDDGGGILGASAYDYPDYSPEHGAVEVLLQEGEWFSLAPSPALA